MFVLKIRLVTPSSGKNFLDIFSIKWLQKFLNSWKSEIILITHDRAFMDSIISHTIYLHRKGARKIEGNTSKLLNLIINKGKT